MENDSFVPDNIPADLEKSWHIPRPTLARSSKSSQGSTSSNNSTQSARSGSLLLTAANLAQIQPDPEDPHTARAHNLRLYLHQTAAGGPPPLCTAPDKKAAPEKKDLDSVSVASSTHFTVVNVNQRPSQAKRSFCRRHQLTMLVMTMSGLITAGILTAILLLEMRAQNQKH